MDEINELIGSLLINVGSEGFGATSGIAMLWGLFFAGGFTAFHIVLEALASMI